MEKKKNGEYRRWRFVILIGLFALLGLLYLFGLTFYRQVEHETGIQQTNTALMMRAVSEYQVSASANETGDITATIDQLVAQYRMQIQATETTQAVLTGTREP
jgi:hypothetical protein